MSKLDEAGRKIMKLSAVDKSKNPYAEEALELAKQLYEARKLLSLIGQRTAMANTYKSVTEGEKLLLDRYSPDNVVTEIHNRIDSYLSSDVSESEENSNEVP